MPEGHTIRRLADDCLDRFGGRAVRASRAAPAISYRGSRDAA